MQKAYSRVIDLIVEDAIDYRAIGLALAKTQPAIFLAIHDAVSGVSDGDAKMNQEMAALIKQDKFVEAIKLCRTVKGWGLKEAKDYHDALRRRVENGESFDVRPKNGLSDNLMLKIKELLAVQAPDATYPDAGSF